MILDLLVNDYTSTLLKYRNFDSYTESVLLNNQLYFSSPKNFNDPIDCKIEIRYDLGSFESVYSKHLDFLIFSKPYLSLTERKNEATIMANRIMKNINNIELRKKLNEDIFNKIDNTIGICSFSSIIDSILLWSHYSNSHRGFCLKINYQVLYNELENLFEKSKIISYLIKKVNYVDKYLELNPYTTDDVLLQIQLFTTKMKCWEYENEYRILIPELVNSKINFSENIFDSIYLGANISSPDFNRVQKILKKRKNKLPLYLANINRGKIIFEQLKY